MGKKHAEEMLFWTTDEFKQFIEVCEDNIVNKTIFTTLYFTGMRIGEALALTKEVVDFKTKTIRINKSLQRLNKEDIITDPKTPKSNRVVTIPDFVCKCLSDYFTHLYELDDKTRIFQISKSTVNRRLKVNAQKAGVKSIRVHDLRHPYVKHTTKKYNSEKQKTQATKIMDLIAWGFCFCIVSYSKRSWTL